MTYEPTLEDLCWNLFDDAFEMGKASNADYSPSYARQAIEDFVNAIEERIAAPAEALISERLAAHAAALASLRTGT